MLPRGNGKSSGKNKSNGKSNSKGRKTHDALRI
jgi:hypothetical protein